MARAYQLLVKAKPRRMRPVDGFCRVFVEGLTIPVMRLRGKPLDVAKELQERFDPNRAEGQRPGVSVCGCDPREVPGVLETPDLLPPNQVDALRDNWRTALTGDPDRPVVFVDGVRVRWRPIVCTCGDRATE